LLGVGFALPARNRHIEKKKKNKRDRKLCEPAFLNFDWIADIEQFKSKFSLKKIKSESKSTFKRLLYSRKEQMSTKCLIKFALNLIAHRMM
jgi:hypothetical protein